MKEHKDWHDLFDQMPQMPKGEDRKKSQREMANQSVVSSVQQNSQAQFTDAQVDRIIREMQIQTNRIIEALEFLLDDDGQTVITRRKSTRLP